MRSEARFPELAAAEGAGHYESFYLKLVRPGGGTAAWIRHTVHKRPGEELTCALWFVLFDADAEGPRATKRQFGPEDLSVPAGCYISVGEERRSGRPRYAARCPPTPSTRAGSSTFTDAHEAFHHLPREFLYRAKLPKTKFLSPYPNAVFDGAIEVGGESIEVDGWRGMVGHNWGAEHAERWVWVQGAAFDGRDPEDYFDMAVGRIKVAGVTTPWVGNGMLDARRRRASPRRVRADPLDEGR